MGKISWPLRRAIAMYQDGETDTVAISQTVGMEAAEIRRALRRRGYEVANVKPGRKRHPEKWEQVAELYGKGMGVGQIGQAVGMHHTTVTYAVKTMANEDRRGFKEEVVRREAIRRAERAEERYERIVEMYRKGRSTNEVAEAFNIDASTVVRILQRMEVRSRSRSHANRLRAKREAVERERRRLAEKLAKQAARIERMMKLAAPKRSRFAA